MNLKEPWSIRRRFRLPQTASDCFRLLSCRSISCLLHEGGGWGVQFACPTPLFELGQGAAAAVRPHPPAAPAATRFIPPPPPHPTPPLTYLSAFHTEFIALRAD